MLPDFKDTLDYIFVSTAVEGGKSLRTTHVLLELGVQTLQQLMPSMRFPSDHLPLLARIQIV